MLWMRHSFVKYIFITRGSWVIAHLFFFIFCWHFIFRHHNYYINLIYHIFFRRLFVRKNSHPKYALLWTKSGRFQHEFKWVSFHLLMWSWSLEFLPAFWWDFGNVQDRREKRFFKFCNSQLMICINTQTPTS